VADISRIKGPEDLRGLGGKWHTATNPGLETISADDAPILIGPAIATNRQGEFTRECVMCDRPVYLHLKDRKTIEEHPDIKTVCEPCYFALTGEIAHG
jgi:hypothetical protein